MRDLIFKRLLSICCILILLISAGMIYSLVSGSIPALGHYGFFQFIGSTEWDPHPDRETYGALSFIVGTLLTSFLALIFCIPFSLPVALFTGEFFRGKNCHVHQFHYRFTCGNSLDRIRIMGILYLPPDHYRDGCQFTRIRSINLIHYSGNHDHPLCILPQWRVHIHGSQRTERGCI